MTETRTCLACVKDFFISDEDMKFYDRISPIIKDVKYTIPTPKLCPECRMQRRIAFRNQMSLYHRKCDLTGKDIISMFSPDKPHKVYEVHEWWSDKWEASEYGREFDFSRPFFEQMKELILEVPHYSIYHAGTNINCDYSNSILDNKNCYLCFSFTRSEDCYYSVNLDNCRDCIDSFYGDHSELLYQCIDCSKCYNGVYLFSCNNCRDSWFCRDCIGCKNCFGCINLSNAEYFWFNEKILREEYEKRFQEFRNSGFQAFEAMKKKWEEFILKFPRRATHNLQCENSSGDQLIQCKNCQSSFNCNNCEDSNYNVRALNLKNSYDTFGGTGVENLYECNSGRGHTMCFATGSYDNTDSYYVLNCFNSTNIFGCCGLKKEKYCILNKKYSKEDYEKLLGKVIAHLQETKEWGEFFPIHLSPFAYNETVAQEYFPLTKQEVHERELEWKDEDEQAKYVGSSYEIPEKISEVQDTVCDAILSCEATGKFYKIIPQELQFYRVMNVPVPRVCFSERHRLRFHSRNPLKLWDRTCAKCSKEIQTSYAPERPEIVYCEECYMKEVY